MPELMYVEAIYRDDDHGCTSLLVVGGQKRYARIWDLEKWPDTPYMEWGWVLNGAARQVWPEHSTGTSPNDGA